MLREALFLHRDGVCCRMEDTVLSWDTLHEEAASIAAFLLLRPDAPVMLYGEKCPDYVAAIAGCLMAGRPYIAASQLLPEERVRLMAHEAKVGVLLDLSRQSSCKLNMDTCETVSFSRAISEKPITALPMVPLDRTAYILFTSGSTGTPKGVQVTHGNLESFLRWFTAIPAIRETEPKVALNQAQFSFDLSVAELYSAFLWGSCIVLLSDDALAEPELRAAALRKSGAQLAVFTPSFADVCLLDDRFCSDCLPDLRAIFFCGEVLRSSTVRRLQSRFPGIRILNAYGPTEATCAVSAVEISAQLCIGTALPIGKFGDSAVTILLVDENNRPVEQNESGRILLLGESVAAGYLGSESGFCEYKGKKTFLTGDIGEWRDGYLWYRGRTDDQLKYKGYRLEPGEVESVLCSLDGITQAVVLPERLPDGRVALLAAHTVCTKILDVEWIRRQLGNKLPEYMVPKKYVFHKVLPITQNGKIDREKVRMFAE